MANRFSMVINLSTNPFRRSCSFGLTLELTFQNKVGSLGLPQCKNFFLAEGHIVGVGSCYAIFL